MVWTIWIGIACATLSCLLWTLFFALREYSYHKLEEIAENNGGRARIEPILKDDTGHALGTGAFGVLLSVVLAVLIVDAFDPLRHPGGGRLIVDWIELLAGIALATLAVFCTAILLPGSIASRAGEKLIHSLIVPLRVMHALTLPLRRLWVVDLAVKRLAGEGHTTEAEEIHEDILSAITEGERWGNLGESERKMIEAVIEFRSHTIEEIMTPRTEIEGFELTDDLEFIREFISKAGHSRIPVYEGDLDHIVGVLYAKDLLEYVGRDPDTFKLRPVLREAVFVPESKPINELLLELQMKKVHMAIVLDEYGGTTGLISFEDVLEEIVGEIQDEHEPVHETNPEITVNPDQQNAEIDARAYIDDANEALQGLRIAIPEGEDYDTVGGYVLSQLGHIPVAGESFRHNGYIVTVLEAEPTRVTRLRLEVVPEQVEETPAEPAPRAGEQPGAEPPGNGQP